MAGTGRYDERMVVRPERDLADLVPVYLERRKNDVISLEDAVQSGDYPEVRNLGHSMKGSGGGYGFAGITEIGARLERAGSDEDARAARAAVDDLKSYLRNVEVRYG